MRLLLNLFKQSKSSTLFRTRNMKYLNQQEAIDVDVELFKEYRFSVDQLMELAGLSCSHAIGKCYPTDKLTNNKVLVICGPGNNGGDGLVCARHLALLGYAPTVVYSQETQNELFKNLLHQCDRMGVEVVNEIQLVDEVDKDFGLIVDALFGFSFKPPIRVEFSAIMRVLCETRVPVASIDIPSGWHVENGPDDQSNDVRPDLLVSLTAPKLCARFFRGRFHYLGGRFVPPALEAKYDLDLFAYSGTDTCVLINKRTSLNN